jgi:hypothetical protein
MTWTKYILILIILYLVCSARTCNEDEDIIAKREEQDIMNLVDSVKHVFMSDSLSDILLKAYEITATEKLNDFADYMKIISDTSLDLRFRQHASGLVRNLFISDEIELPNLGKAYPEKDIKTLEQLLSYSSSEGIPYWIRPIQIDINKPFRFLNDSTFKGSLSFKYLRLSTISQDTLDISSGKIFIEIYLMKKTRSFGKEQLRVWEVYLGGIK